MQTSRWIPRALVLERYHTSDSSLTRWVKANQFPAPKRFGAMSDRWDINELDVYDADPEAWKSNHVLEDAVA
jgi:predicted DNA-binding transcriptional regulator AlpA